jgi:chaperonin cofactor prefoldin
MEKITVQRANVVLDISPEDKKFYMSQGYSVIDEKGKVIEEAMSNDVATLQNQVAHLKEKLAKAEETIAELSKAKRRIKE